MVRKREAHSALKRDFLGELDLSSAEFFLFAHAAREGLLTSLGTTVV